MAALCSDHRRGSGVVGETRRTLWGRCRAPVFGVARGGPGVRRATRDRGGHRCAADPAAGVAGAVGRRGPMVRSKEVERDRHVFSGARGRRGVRIRRPDAREALTARRGEPPASSSGTARWLGDPGLAVPTKPLVPVPSVREAVMLRPKATPLLARSHAQGRVRPAEPAPPSPYRTLRLQLLPAELRCGRGARSPKPRVARSGRTFAQACTRRRRYALRWRQSSGRPGIRGCVPRVAAVNE